MLRGLDSCGKTGGASPDHDNIRRVGPLRRSLSRAGFRRANGAQRRRADGAAGCRLDEISSRQFPL
jgi:hypothetical protein